MASPPRPTAGPSKRSSRSSGSIGKKLTGRWRLMSYTARPDRGKKVYPLGTAAKGVLDYSREGNVSVHIMGSGYFAYCGYYTVDEKARTVTHHLELCSDHNLAGASNLRHIALEGARLVLSGSMELHGKPHTIRVVWERQAAEPENRR
ncbi:MAG TPA: lipocalin-like domain-containing protein [Burkholderiales bacterium]|nr:lipocalin-like domain-containing protein [Burkholderiales bacterium]